MTSITINTWNRATRAFVPETINVDIVSVRRTSLPKGGWKYEAVMADGTVQLIRAKATRCYLLAHLHSNLVCSGKRGLGAVISFGQRASTYAPLARTFAIDDANDTLDPPGYAARVAELEAEGLTTSDAQAVADAEFGGAA